MKQTFKLFSTEAEAKAFCDHENASGSYYKRKKHPAIYTPCGVGFVCWYWG